METRSVIIAFGLVIAAIAVGAGLLLTSRPDPVQIVVNPPVPTPTSPPTATPGPLQVYVTGAVNIPQTTHILVPGSRVQDAINAAGGARPDANLDGVNLAALLRDGDQVHIPAVGEPQSGLPTPSGGEIVFINRATLEELTTLPRIGEVIGQRIIDYRETNGPFVLPEDLLNVSGIGEATLEQILPLISFE